MDFYYQNACFFHFMVCLIDPLNRLFELLWLNFARSARSIAKATNASRKTRSLVLFMGRWLHWTVLANCNITVNGDRYQWDDIQLFFVQNGRELDLTWHVVSAGRCHIPHSTHNNGLIERRVRYIFYFALEPIGRLDHVI